MDYKPYFLYFNSVFDFLKYKIELKVISLKDLAV